MFRKPFLACLLWSWTAVSFLATVDFVWANQDAESVEPAQQLGAEGEIFDVLKAQTDCWNRQDIEGFMETYWNSDQLTFSGGGRTVRGWQATLDRYRQKYPPEKMGQLKFDHVEMTHLSNTASLVLGQWHLATQQGKFNGNFSLVLRKIDGKWKIIHDHSSTLAAQ